MWKTTSLALGLVLLAGGCVNAIEPLAVAPAQEVQPSDFAGVWEVTMPESPTLTLGTRVFITHTAGSMYELGASGSDGVVTGTVQLSEGPGLVVGAIKLHGEDRWSLVGVITDQIESGVLGVVLPSADVFGDAVESGPLTGTVSVVGLSDSPTEDIDVDSSGAQLRAFVDDASGASRFENDAKYQLVHETGEATPEALVVPPGDGTPADGDEMELEERRLMAGTVAALAIALGVAVVILPRVRRLR